MPTVSAPRRMKMQSHGGHVQGSVDGGRRSLVHRSPVPEHGGMLAVEAVV